MPLNAACEHGVSAALDSFGRSVPAYGIDAIGKDVLGIGALELDDHVLDRQAVRDGGRTSRAWSMKTAIQGEVKIETQM
jgi:hypothetical protein